MNSNAMQSQPPIYIQLRSFKARQDRKRKATPAVYVKEVPTFAQKAKHLAILALKTARYSYLAFMLFMLVWYLTKS